MGKYIYYLFRYMCMKNMDGGVIKNRVNQWIINGLKKLIFLIEHKKKWNEEKDISGVRFKSIYTEIDTLIRGLEIFDDKYLKFPLNQVIVFIQY